MKNIYPVLVFALMLVSCANQNLNLATIANIHSAKLHATPHVSILVISDDERGQLWYMLGENRTLESIDSFPKASVLPIDHISISPDDHWIAVMAVGEGHPIIEVYDLQAVLHDDDVSAEKKSVQSLLIDPYPGYVQMMTWQGDQLIVSSDVALDHLDKTTRRVPSEKRGLAKENIFQWHISTDSITRQ